MNTSNIRFDTHKVITRHKFQVDHTGLGSYTTHRCARQRHTRKLGFPIFGRWKASLITTTVVLVLVLLVVTPIRKMPKALLIRNGKLQNFAYTFVTSFPADLLS